MGIRAQGLAGLGGDAPSHTSARQAPLVWRAPEGPEGLAAVPVGGGGAWPGFETTRRAFRLAGGPPPTGMHNSPAQRAAGASGTRSASWTQQQRHAYSCSARPFLTARSRW